MINEIKHYAIPCGCKQKEQPVIEQPTRYLDSRYTELKLDASMLLRDELTGAYTCQGGTTDGNFIYRALVKEDNEPTKLQKLTLTGEVVLERTVDVLGHANDMTYCSKDGLLYIAHSSSTSIVYKVNPTNLTLVDTINVGPAIWGISYNETDDLFILGNVGASYLSVYSYDFNFMYRIKPGNAFSGMVRQGIACTENYIYVALDNAYGTILENEKGSTILVYTWNGMFIKSIFIDIKEIEFLALDGSNFIIGTYEGRNLEDVKTCRLYKAPFDLYPGQTVQTGRPTDVSGGLNNLQRLPEGTPVRLWEGSVTSGSFTLKVPGRLAVNEDGPFRYLRFRFKGANQQVFDWYPLNTGTVALREVDITDAVEDTTFRVREMRLVYNHSSKTFTIQTNLVEEIKQDVSEKTITITKNPSGIDGIELTQVWGVV